MQTLSTSVQLYRLKLELEFAEAAGQQKPAPRLLPILKRRTRALPSIMLEEGERCGITHTSTDPGEEEHGPIEGSPV